MGVLILLYYSNIRIFSADFRRIKFGGEFGYRRRLGCNIHTTQNREKKHRQTDR